jgi:hypothetical protein
VALTFTTWDGFPGSHDLLDLSGGQDLKTVANSIAQAFLGSPSALLSGTAGVSGPFKVEAEYVRRSAQRTVAVIAIMPAGAYAAKPFVLSDVGGGSALAQFGDAHAAQCEVFKTAAVQKIDILWVVDNSGSMYNSQLAVANAGQAMIDQLSNSTLDWRIAATTSAYYEDKTGADALRPFTTNVNQIRQWFQAGNSTSFGTSGNPDERLLESAMEATQALLPTQESSTVKLRTGATLVIILLGDVDDQSSMSAAYYTTYFSNYDNLGSKAQVHGHRLPRQRHLVQQRRAPQQRPQGLHGRRQPRRRLRRRPGRQHGGRLLRRDHPGHPQRGDRGREPYSTQKPPIASTIQGRARPCLAGRRLHLQRQRPAARPHQRLRLRRADPAHPFFGACRPTVPNRDGAVSYRYWIDLTANPNGNPDPCGQCTPPFVCDRNQNKCVCPADCGVASPGAAYYCDYDTCQWTCAPDCNGCGTTSCATPATPTPAAATATPASPAGWASGSTPPPAAASATRPPSSAARRSTRTRSCAPASASPTAAAPAPWGSPAISRPASAGSRRSRSPAAACCAEGAGRLRVVPRQPPVQSNDAAPPSA